MSKRLSRHTERKKLAQFARRTSLEHPERERSRAKECSTQSRMGRLLSCAGYSRTSLGQLWLAALVSMTLLTAIASAISHIAVLPLVAILGFALPFLYLERRVRDRAEAFADAYPNFLLAVASSTKAGLAPYQAIERSIEMLEPHSVLRQEITAFLEELRCGCSRAEAIAHFATTVSLVEIELFRTALDLALEHGVRFAVTLEYLAIIAGERRKLIRLAMIKTASMRMTAMLLLLLAPMMLVPLAARTPDYFALLRSDPLANMLASAGVGIVVTSVLLLERMSRVRI